MTFAQGATELLHHLTSYWDADGKLHVGLNGAVLRGFEDYDDTIDGHDPQIQACLPTSIPSNLNPAAHTPLPSLTVGEYPLCTHQDRNFAHGAPPPWLPCLEGSCGQGRSSEAAP